MPQSSHNSLSEPTQVVLQRILDTLERVHALELAKAAGIALIADWGPFADEKLEQFIREHTGISAPEANQLTDAHHTVELCRALFAETPQTISIAQALTPLADDLVALRHMQEHLQTLGLSIGTASEVQIRAAVKAVGKAKRRLAHGRKTRESWG